jgi:hypothetical protein
MNKTNSSAARISTRKRLLAKATCGFALAVIFVGSIGDKPIQAQANQATPAPTITAQKHTNQRKTNRAAEADTATSSEPSPKANASSEAVSHDAASGVRFAYEFKASQFTISNIRIEHDAAGRGRMTFTKRDREEPFTETILLSPAALTRINNLWTKLDRLKGKPDFQASKQFPHLGTMTLSIEEAGETRATEFNWTQNPDALALATEYRRLSDQTLFIFDIKVARENQPLEAPSIMKRLEILVRRKDISDGKQLLPFLRELSLDERLPLIARNQAGSLAKKLEKN